jgi:hypothetical protein
MMQDLHHQLSELTPEGIFEKYDDLVIHRGPPSAELMQPFTFKRRDEDAMQDAARRIADFMGLRNHAFSVHITELPPGVAGCIAPEHADDAVVPIDISFHATFFNDAVLGILTHEIAHQYLHIHGVTYGEGEEHRFDNEVLTDVACTYLGLGKLVLRGCTCEHRVSEIMSHVEYVHVRREQVGYLEPQQHALVYMRVIHELNLPQEVWLPGLNLSARKLLEAASMRFRPVIEGWLA